MAQSRLEKVASVFKRIQSLKRGGAMKDEDLPIWYAVYERFPPKHEPTFDRPVEEKLIKPIFYPEDVIRAKFQSEFQEGCFTKLHTNLMSKTQEFLAIYKQKQQEGLPTEELYSVAVEDFKTKFSLTNKKTEEEEKKAYLERRLRRSQARQEDTTLNQSEEVSEPKQN